MNKHLNGDEDNPFGPEVTPLAVERTESAAISHLDKPHNEKPMVYKDPVDNRWVIRNSKIGTCPRELWAAWKGMEPAQEGQRYGVVAELDPNDINSDPMKEGHLHEAHMKQLLQEKGWQLSGFEEEFVLLIGDCKVVGHADVAKAVCPVTGIEYFGEMKSMGKQAFIDFLDKGWDMFPTYLVQLSTGMIATGLPGIVWVKCRDNGRILPPFMFFEPPVSRTYIMKKVLAIKAAVESDQMPLCGVWRETNSWCKYTQLHDEQDLAPEGQVDVPELAAVLELYKRLGATTQIFIDPQTKQPEIGPKGKPLTETAKRKQLREVIEQNLAKLNTKAILAGEHRAIVGEEKMSFDEAKLKLEHPEIWMKFRTKPKAGTLRVVKVGEKDSGGDGDAE